MSSSKNCRNVNVAVPNVGPSTEIDLRLKNQWANLNILKQQALGKAFHFACNLNQLACPGPATVTNSVVPDKGHCFYEALAQCHGTTVRVVRTAIHRVRLARLIVAMCLVGYEGQALSDALLEFPTEKVSDVFLLGTGVKLKGDTDWHRSETGKVAFAILSTRAIPATPTTPLPPLPSLPPLPNIKQCQILSVFFLYTIAC
jgi:hypothetical protein